MNSGYPLPDTAVRGALRVLHVAESAKGGVGSYLSYTLPSQIEALGPGGVRVVAPAQHRSQIAGVPDAAVRTFERPERSPRSLLALARATLAEVRAFRPDVIHAHSTFAGLVVRAGLAATPRRPWIVYCPHGWAFDVEASPWQAEAIAAVERRMARGCDRIVAISRFEAAQAHAIGIPPRRVTLVLSGVPEAPAGPVAPWDDARRKVLFVGRLDRQKGVDVLYDAVRDHADALAVRVVGVSVADGGDGLQPPANVEMLGWLDAPGVAAQMRAADVVAIPSRWEGFGLVALEAMRAGKPVVASRVGGLPELVDDGVTGRLVPPESAIWLSKALLEDDATALARMGAQGRLRYAAKFTAARMNVDLLAVYTRLMQPAPLVQLFPERGAPRPARATP